MKAAKIWIVVFSPTGSSLAAAQLIGSVFEGTAETVDLCRPEGRQVQIPAEDLVIFSVPCYGGRIPLTAEKRLSRVQGNGTPAVLCVTYGNRAYEDALTELSDLAEANGFVPVAGCAVVTEHNIMHVYGKGRPDTADREEIRTWAGEIRRRLGTAEGLAVPAFPGNRPYKTRGIIRLPVLTEEAACTNCGLCAKECPVQAISSQPGDHWKTDEEICIDCMRCVALCSTGSRHIPDQILAGMIKRMEPACSGRKENAFF